MKLSDYDVNHPFSTTLVSTERITPLGWEAEVRHLVLRLPNVSFDYVEGQSIGVLAPGPHEFGNSHHLRLYSIASPRHGDDGRGDSISLCVRRCFSIDDISGERYPGRASHFLCDAVPGDLVPITGPYGNQFEIPPNEDANLLMVGAGTGIAPFRAFVKRIYQRHGEWKGKVRLFYGAKSGMELLYMNDYRRDLALFYDQSSFRAFEAISPRPYYDDSPALDRVLMENSHEIWDLIQDPRTYVYVAGLQAADTKFELAMAEMAGGKDNWIDTKVQLQSGQRYAELLYS